MPFSNPIVGGTILIRPAIQSPDYDAGVAGWSINKDGSAEFNDVTIRGSVGIGGEAFYYSPTPGLGNLVASVSASNGVDPFGNPYLGGVVAYEPSTSAHVRMSANLVARYEYQPRKLAAQNYLAGTINTTADGSLRGGVSMSSPSYPGNTSQASFTMFGGGPTTNDTSILFSADRTNFSDAVEVTDSLTAGNMEWGTVQTAAPGAGGGTTSANVTFSKTFPAVPRVMITISSTADPGATTIRAYASAEATTGFTVTCYRSTNAATNIRWFAVSD